MSKKLKIGLILASIIIIIGIAMIFVIKNKDAPKENNESINNTIVSIIYDGNTWLIKYNEETEKIDEYYNNKYKNTINKEFNKSQIIRLYTTEGSNDLNRTDKISNNTFESSLKESTEYVNLLKKNEYSIIFEAYTYKFIELYLTKDNKSFKRLIITDSYIVEYETNKINEINIQDYIFK